MKKFFVIVLALSVMGVFCACEKAPAPETAGDTGGAAAPAVSTLDKIKDAGKLVAGVKDSVVPFGYVDEKKRELVGFDVDICRHIAKKLKVDIEFKAVTSANRIQMLTDGEVDILAATMTHKIERDEVIDFSITYFMDGQRLLVAKDSTIESVADLAGKKVGSVKGSTSEKNVKEAQPKCEVISFEGYPEAFLALKQGKVEAVTTDSVILVGLKGSDEHPENWKIVGEFFSSEPYGLGVPENDSEWRDFVNFTLMEMWVEGEWQKIYDKWLGPDTNYYMPLSWRMELWP
ncbi:MAG: ABC transporter substrate-binding protein [Deltaproteobacteria bacterium]|uniref:ABC transporter substrate-binding protein n=1 Tax=Candidatus Zymogenus saltonus TaxID=2844893 RepID=A0A9D8KJF7_9DELT|nr:ABC transporter substrate-binding protein [Candidatus Zymogenus saltonus]